MTSFGAEAIVIACYLITFRLIAANLGTIGFGEYALSRRMLALIAPLGLMGADMAMARYLAFGRGETGDRLQGYVAAAVVTAIVAAGLLAAVLLGFRDAISQLFFGSTAFSDLVTPMPLLLLGSGLHGVAYGYLRGTLAIQRANLLVVINQGLVPLVCALALRASVAMILVAMACGWIVVAIAFLSRTPTRVVQLRLRVRELLGYGYRRVPGDLLQLALFALPGVLVAHSGDITRAGLVAFGVAAIGMVGSALTPIQFVLLPVAARHLSAGSVGLLRRHVWDLVWPTVILLVTGTIIAELGASALVRFYLGPGFEQGVDSLRLILLGALPWGMLVTLRSVVDARHYRAVNARNMAVAFACFVVAAAALRFVFGAESWTAVAAFVVSLYVAGILTAVEAAKITRPNSSPPALDAIDLPTVGLPADPVDVLSTDAAPKGS